MNIEQKYIAQARQLWPELEWIKDIDLKEKQLSPGLWLYREVF